MKIRKEELYAEVNGIGIFIADTKIFYASLI
jgi:hypothetical protein